MALLVFKHQRFITVYCLLYWRSSIHPCHSINSIFCKAAIFLRSDRKIREYFSLYRLHSFLSDQRGSVVIWEREAQVSNPTIRPDRSLPTGRGTHTKSCVFAVFRSFVSLISFLSNKVHSSRSALPIPYCSVVSRSCVANRSAFARVSSVPCRKGYLAPALSLIDYRSHLLSLLEFSIFRRCAPPSSRTPKITTVPLTLCKSSADSCQITLSTSHFFGHFSILIKPGTLI